MTEGMEAGEGGSLVQTSKRKGKSIRAWGQFAMLVAAFLFGAWQFWFKEIFGDLASARWASTESGYPWPSFGSSRRVSGATRRVCVRSRLTRVTLSARGGSSQSAEDGGRPTALCRWDPSPRSGMCELSRKSNSALTAGSLREAATRERLVTHIRGRIVRVVG